MTRRISSLRMTFTCITASLAMVLSVGTGAAPAQAAEDDAVVDVRRGLIALGVSLGGAAGLEPLATDFPLTDVAVRDVLRLDTAIATYVDEQLTGVSASLDSLHELFDDPQGALELSEPARLAGGVYEWDLDMHLTDHRRVPLRFQDERVRFGAGSLDGEIAGSLDGSLRLRYDPAALELRRFMIVDEAELTAHTWTRAAGSRSDSPDTVGIDAFEAVDGFVAEELGGAGAAATVDATTVLRLRDPNGRGLITTEDLTFGAAPDLFVVATPPANNAVTMTLPIRTAMLGTAAHGDITVSARTSADPGPWGAVRVTRDAALDRLTSVSRAQALGGFSSFAGALVSVESAVDARIPMLDTTLTDMFSPATSLMDFLSEQGTALIMCGAADTSPPTGSPVPGQTRYCQARTDGLEPDAGTTITWRAADGATITSTTQGTVGSEPSANVAVTGGGGFPRLTVEFVAGGQTRTARTLVNSIQELGAIVGELGFGGAISYDTTNQTLELALSAADPDVTRPAVTGGGESLAPVTGLTGLCQAATGITPRECAHLGPNGLVVGAAPAPDTRPASVTATGRSINATFGLGLVDPSEVPEAGKLAPQGPVVYLRPAADGTVWQIDDLAVSLPGQAPMTARIGFLQTDVELTAYSLTTSGTAASVRVSPVAVPVAGGTVPGAVEIARLSATNNDLGQPAPLVPQVSRGISARATLAVQDAPDEAGVRPVGKQGGIDATWTDLSADALPAVQTSGDFDALRLFDLIPSIRGTASAGSSGGMLVDPNADFLRDLGLSAGDSDEDRTSTRRLYDLSTGRTCAEYLVIDATTLRCTKGTMLATDDQTVVDRDGQSRVIPGDPAQPVAAGDSYLIGGRPEALRDVILNSLAGVMNILATPDESLHATDTFPLINLRPDEVSTARNRVDEALSLLKDEIAASDGTSAGATGISTLQGFAKALRTARPGVDARFTLTTTGDQPSLRLAVDSAATDELQVPLRLLDGDRQLRVLSGVDEEDQPVDIQLPIRAASSSLTELAVSLTTGEALVGRGTRVVESVRGFGSTSNAIARDIAAKAVEFGATASTVIAHESDAPGSDSNARVDIGIDVTTAPATGSDAWLALADFPGTLVATRTARGSGADCGFSGSPGACATLTLDTPGTPTLVQLSYAADASSGGSGANLDAQPLAVRFLADSLGSFAGTLQDSLDGNLADMTMPLVGADLDAGADIPAAVTAVSAAARTALTGATAAFTDETATTVADLRLAIEASLSDISLANPTTSTGSVTAVILCSGGTACAEDATMAQVREVRATMTVSGRSTASSQFDVGLAGLPVVSNLPVATTTDWTLGPITTGIKRGTGPFLLLIPESGQSTVDVLDAHVTTNLQTRGSEADLCHPWSRLNGPDGLAARETAAALKAVSDNPGFSPDPLLEVAEEDSASCIDAIVGFLPAVLVDRGETGVDTHIEVSVAPGDGSGPADGDGRVYLPALFGRELPTNTVAAGGTSAGAIDVYFESFASDLGFFDVVGTIRAEWSQGQWLAQTAVAGDEASFAYDHLRIDGSTVGKVIDVGYGVAAKALAPLNPVVDALTAKVPVASQLAEAIGGTPITTLTLLSKAKQNIKLVENLLEFQQLLAHLPAPSDTPDLIPLSDGPVGGRFLIENRDFAKASCTASVDYRAQGGQKISRSGKTKASGRCKFSPAPAGTKPTKREKLANLKNKAAAFASSPTAYLRQPKKVDPASPYNPGTKNGKKTQKNTSVLFSLPSITVPVLEDSNQVYDLLLATGDASLLNVDLGRIGASVGFLRSFGPLMIGPVPLVAQIGIDFGVEGRFSFGFDTHGLTQKLEGLDEIGDVRGLSEGPKPELFRDGFHINDLDSSGTDLPEIKFITTVYAGASVSIGFAEAGIQGGASIDLSLDAFDPNQDGKIRYEEFAGVGADCAFDVSSGIEFFLQFRLFVDLFVTSISKSWDIARSPRLKLFEFSCERTPPVLAVYDDTSDLLTLTIGDPDARRIKKDVISETYVVRQMDAAGTSFEVTAFNIKQYFQVAAGTKIVADAQKGNDTIKLLPGQLVSTDSEGNRSIDSIDFTADSLLTGGDGADKISTGSGRDDVSGDDGPDTIDGGAGNDTLNGGPKADTLSGGPGRDTLDGGSGDDSLNGGAGADIVEGGSGDDTADGGSGADRSALFPTVDARAIARLLDSGDAVAGGPGDDTVTGGEGSDLVSGGDLDTESLTFTSTEQLNVLGVQNSGGLVEVPVTLETLDLPSLATVRAQCSDPGTVSPDVDRVSGGAQRDFVLGGGGPDDLSGGAGDDLVCGRGGDDLLLGDGPDTIVAEEGADEILGGPGADRIYAAGGDDVVTAGSGNDLVRAGQGADTVNGGSGADLLLGEEGRDTISGDAGSTSGGAAGTARALVCRIETSIVLSKVDLNGDLIGDQFDDGQLEGRPVSGGVVLAPDGSPYTGMVGSVVFSGGAADLDGDGATGTRADTGVVGLAGMTGAVGNGDCIFGGDDADGDLLGGDGGDYIDGGAGAEPNISGGVGDDVVRGGTEDDHVFGDEGNDLVVGDSGDDILEGNADNDVLRGGAGDDLMIGGSQQADAPDGSDELLGDRGRDVLAGDNAAMTRGGGGSSAISGATVTLLAGPDQRDELYGGFDEDWVFGQAGDDLVRGGHDDDVVEGGPGADTVQGDDGNDLIVGGSSTGSSTGGRVTVERSGQDAPDAGDLLLGDEGVDGLDGNDVIAGDNARLDPNPGGAPLIQLFDVELAATPGAELSPPAGAEDLTAGAVDPRGGRGQDVIRGGPGDDVIFGQGGQDVISAGDGDDVAEGNAGADLISGDGGQDDLIGGGSARDGAVTTATVNRLLTAPDGLLDTSAAGLADSGDSLYGGTAPGGDPGVAVDSHDVLLGDNGRITREAAGSGFASMTGIDNPRLVRVVAMADATAPLALATGGNDALYGQAGDDDLYGQFDRAGAPSPEVSGVRVSADLLDGGTGNDALIGDQGVDVPTPASELGDETTLRDRAGFLIEQVLAQGSLVRVVTLTQIQVGGDDVLLGGAGDDAIHAGSGNDLINGGADEDALFAGDGDDAAWGGADHDRIFGGDGADSIDIKVRPGDPAIWSAVRPLEDEDGLRSTVNGQDLIYGGRGADVMQADMGDGGKRAGDRLSDWIGNNNLYFVCDSGYGAGQVLRAQSPGIKDALVGLARAVGADAPGTVGSSGHGELALLDKEKEPKASFAQGKGKGVCEAG